MGLVKMLTFPVMLVGKFLKHFMMSIIGGAIFLGIGLVILYLYLKSKGALI